MSTKVLDDLQVRFIELAEEVMALGKIVRRQVILTNILQRKMEVTDVEIIEEEKRIYAKLKNGE